MIEPLPQPERLTPRPKVADDVGYEARWAEMEDGALRKGESNVAVPSIKGAAFAFVVEKVLRLVTSGEISRSELARGFPRVA